MGMIMSKKSCVTRIRPNAATRFPLKAAFLGMIVGSIVVSFQLVSHYQPDGDQPQAIEQLVQGLHAGEPHQVMQGITGSGKTFTMANVIDQVQRPTLVISPTKTLADQTYKEFKGFFPHNAVELFVSNYILYQPQVYVPRSDTYYAKLAALDEELTRRRLAAATAAIRRRDVIMVASVSCIFDIGSPNVCRELAMSLAVGATVDGNEVLARLAHIGYSQVGGLLHPKAFRVGEGYVNVFPPYENVLYRIQLLDDRVNRLLAIDPQSGDLLQKHTHISIYPARLHVLPEGRIEEAIAHIREELAGRLLQLRRQGSLLEAQRLEAATLRDVELLREEGRCPGMEVYCRALNRRQPGAPPASAIDYFPEDFLVFVDESHVTIPQIRGMHSGSHQRMKDLVDHGFRLPSAMDFRPLVFGEWEQRVPQVVFVSATPGPYELEKAGGAVVEQVIRPTGLLDPIIETVPSSNQMACLLREIQERVAAGERHAGDDGHQAAGRRRCELLVGAGHPL